MMEMSTEQVLAFNRGVIEEFRSNDGRVGGHLAGNPMLLLTMTGARTGRRLTTPLTFHIDGDDFIVMASAAGSNDHPAWFHNVSANPAVQIEVGLPGGIERFDATVTVTEGAERQRVCDSMVTALPRFGEYLSTTDREIPILRLACS